MDNPEMLRLIVAWIAVIGFVILARTRRNAVGVGLTIAYLLNLSLIHLTGAAIYLLPGFQDKDARLTTAGFLQSTYGVIAFAFGSLVIAPWILKRRSPSQLVDEASIMNPALPRVLMLFGLLLYALSLTSFSTLPSMGAIVSTGQQLILAGLVLSCWSAWRAGRFLTVTGWLVLSLLMPITTVLTSGMLGYGVVAILTLLTFVLGLVKSPVRILVGGCVLTYLGLSFFVSYMRDRAEIRDSVWGNQSYEDRADRASESLSNFEWFDPDNRLQLQRIDDRLNQNSLVGAAVNRLSETNDYARGDTLWQAVLALIPRAIWADKPIEAGSGDLVTRFTGIQFVEGTSVGIGQVMEFYANFGTLGVFSGFLVLGIIVTLFDTFAAACLNASNYSGFLLWYLPGLSLLQVGGQLVEITASAAGSLIVALLVNKYLSGMHADSTPLLFDPVSESL
jgi:hypothetical protein